MRTAPSKMRILWTGLFLTVIRALPQQFQFDTTLTPNGVGGYDYYGSPAVLSGNGRCAIVSASGRTVNGSASVGSVFAFFRSSTAVSWGAPQEIIASDWYINGRYGWALAIAKDCSVAVVTAPYHTLGSNTAQGAAYVISRNATGDWEQIQQLTASDGAAGDSFGWSVSLSDDGLRLLIGAAAKRVGANSQQGAVYVFNFNGTAFLPQGNLTAFDGGYNDKFGQAVAMDANASVAVVTAAGKNANGVVTAYAFYRFPNGSWSAGSSLTVSSVALSAGFGTSVALSPNGSHCIIGAPGTTFDDRVLQGAAYLFTRSYTTNTWAYTAMINASDGATLDRFGQAVKLAFDGNSTLAFISAPFASFSGGFNQGVVYVHVEGNWSVREKIAMPFLTQYSYFGNSVSTYADGSVALMGGASTAFLIEYATVTPSPSISPTMIASRSSSRSPSVSPSTSVTPSMSPSTSVTPSMSPSTSATPSVTMSASASVTTSGTRSSTAAVTPTITGSVSGSGSTSPSISMLPSGSAPASATPSNTAAQSASSTKSSSTSRTASGSRPVSPSGTWTTTASLSATAAESRSVSPSSTWTATSSLSPTATITATASLSSTPTWTSTGSVSVTASVSISSTQSQTRSVSPSGSVSPAFSNRIDAVKTSLHTNVTAPVGIHVSLHSNLCGDLHASPPSYIIIADNLRASTISITPAVGTGTLTCTSTADSSTEAEAQDRLHYSVQTTASASVVYVSAAANFNTSAPALQLRTITCRWRDGNVSIQAVVVSSAWPIWSSFDVSTTHSNSMLNGNNADAAGLRLFTTPNATLSFNITPSTVRNGRMVGNSASFDDNFGLNVTIGHASFLPLMATLISNSTAARQYSMSSPLASAVCSSRSSQCGPVSIGVSVQPKQSLHTSKQLAGALCGTATHDDIDHRVLMPVISNLHGGRHLAASDLPLLPSTLLCPPFCPSTTQYHALLSGSSTLHGVLDAYESVSKNGVLYFSGTCASPSILPEENTRVCANASDPRSYSCMYGDGEYCYACPAGALCVGGRLMWSRAGFWLGSESESQLLACRPPAQERCSGWSAASGTTQCGTGYVQHSVGCSMCAEGYYLHVDFTCLPCASTSIDTAYILDTLAVIGCIAAFAILLYSVAAVCQRKYGGTREGGVKRTINFIVSCYLTLQIFAELGQHVPAGIPSYMAAVYRVSGSLQGDGILVNPVCLGASLFTSHYIRLGFGMWLAVVFVSFRAAYMKTSLVVLPRVYRVSAWGQRAALTLASACFAMVAQSATTAFACQSTTVTFLAYTQMVQDGSAIQHTTAFSSYITGNPSMHSVSLAAENDDSVNDVQFDVYTMSGYPSVVCFEGPHVPFLITALCCVAFYIVALHAYVCVLLRQKSVLPLKLLAGQITPRKSGLSRAPAPPSPSPRPPVHASNSRKSTSALKPDSSFTENPLLVKTQAVTSPAVRRPSSPAIADALADIPLAYYLAGDYRAGARYMRFWDLFVLFCLACVASFLGPGHPSNGSSNAAIAQACIVIALMCCTALLLLLLQPLVPSASWQYAFRVWTLVTTVFCALFNMVSSLTQASGGPSTASTTLSYAAFACACVLVCVLIASFLVSMRRGAKEEQKTVQTAARVSLQPLKALVAPSLHHTASFRSSLEPVDSVRRSIMLSSRALPHRPSATPRSLFAPANATGRSGRRLR